MNWHLIQSGASTGQFNMDFDIRLAKECKPDEAYFRLYRWEPYSISLGANQKIEEINQQAVDLAGIDVVTRPTGGRAILHAEELTYSVVVPVSMGISSRDLYTKISLALVEGLKDYSPALSDVELENEQPDFSALLKNPSGSLCFASTAKSEVKYHGKKLIGSAQRKMDKAILQHGSILTGAFHQKLPEFINESDENKNLLKSELINKTTEIETITGCKTDYDLLAQSIISGFARSFSINWVNAQTTSEHLF